MTIRKGEEWGRAVERPADLVAFGSDRELALDLAGGRDRHRTVTAGDLHRSVGSPTERSLMQELPIDVLDVDVDGVGHLAVAHVIVRASWWRGAVVAALNVDHVGDWDVAPRAHPNDGRLDVVEVDSSMSLRQRWQARSRLPHGTHLPHPAIAVRSASEVAWTFEPPLPVWLDGERLTPARSVSVRIRPDAATILV